MAREINPWTRRPLHYDLEGRPVKNPLMWAEMFEARIHGYGIWQTHLPSGYYISTVWLGTDHNYYPEGPPLIFETMIFIEGSNRPCAELGMERYSTKAEALAGHAAYVKRWMFKKHASLRKDIGW